MKILKLNEMAVVVNFDVEKLITHVTFADDWQGIFLGDKKLEEGDSMQLRDIIKKLIENNIQMGDYKYSDLNLYKNGSYEDWVTEDESYEIFGDQLPDSLTEYINKCIELGYEIKLN